MYRIVPCITSLLQHIETLQNHPEVYRPLVCPTCGLLGLWKHGCYTRKAARRSQNDKVSNPIPIPRYLCAKGCKKTCSRLPACIAPRRWYNWAIQQSVLLLLLCGHSFHQCSHSVHLDRRTVRRWWIALQSRHQIFALFLLSRFVELGRTVDWRAFWIACLKCMSLCDAMAWLDQNGVVVP